MRPSSRPRLTRVLVALLVVEEELPRLQVDAEPVARGAGSDPQATHSAEGVPTRSAAVGSAAVAVESALVRPPVAAARLVSGPRLAAAPLEVLVSVLSQKSV